MSYKDKVVVITGGASGLGWKFAETMLLEGAKVVLFDLHSKRLGHVKRDFVNKGFNLDTFVVDVSSLEDLESGIHEVMDLHGRIDVLFNNAGIGMMGNVVDSPFDVWDRMINVNIKSVIYGTKLVCPIMRAQGGGQIINTASLAGLLPMPGAVPYSMSKHAVVGLSLGLRSEVKCHNINVSVLCPAFVKTRILTDSETFNVHESALSKVVNRAGGAISLDSFIEEAMDGIRKNKAIIVLPKKARFAYRLFRYLPKKFLSSTERIGKSMQKLALKPS